MNPRSDTTTSEPAPTILVIDADTAARARVERTLDAAGFRVDLARDHAEAAVLVKAGRVDAVLFCVGDDPETNGDRVGDVCELVPWLPVVALVRDVGEASQSRAASLGAAECLPQAVDDDLLARRLRVSIAAARESHETARLFRSVEEARLAGEPFGYSPAFRRAMDQVREVIPTETAVLLLGEPGTGKRFTARHIHEEGPRASGPFVEVAASRPVGLEDLSRAHGPQPAAGTLYVTGLDELDGRGIVALGRALARPPCPRLILSACKPLGEVRRSEAGTSGFLDELGCVRIRVPALRDRREDIALLATAFLDRAARGAAHDGFSIEALVLLHLLPWAGNLRELEGTVTSAFRASGGRRIGRGHLLGPGGVAVDPGAKLGVDCGGPLAAGAARWLAGTGDVLPFEEEERRILAHAIQAAGGHIATAARLLGIGRATLYRKVRSLGLGDMRRGRSHHRNA